MPTDPDTIAAIATARGRAALAIIRVSGPEARTLVTRRFHGADLTDVASHTAHVGYVVDAEGDELDQVVATVFQGPRSATGEDVVEVSCHGGDLAPQLVLDALLQAGARMAEPGEFTERAFLNGKLDLAQAEAVADLIHASSEQAHRVSMQHLRGRYSDRLSNLREELLDLCALMELEIDFSEEDVEFADRERLTTLLDTAQRLVSTLLDSYRTGELLRDGVRVVIGGRPNAGKSTLLNALVGRDRAIVSATPGTTRDEIEAEAELDGLLFRFVDTAGLRDTSDQIEAEGVRRAEESIREADVLLYVYDQQRGLDADERTFLQELADTEPSVPTVVVANKSDTVATERTPDLETGMALSFSALRAFDEARELERLTTALLDQVDADLRDTEASAVVMNKRHRQHLQEAKTALERAQTAYEQGVSSDLLTLDLREALHALGAITGEVTNEDVLGQIFSQFCIGK